MEMAVVEREWVRAWIAAMFDVALGLLLMIIGIVLLILGGSVESLMYQYASYSIPELRLVIITGYAIAVFVIIYGLKRMIDSILKAWAKTTVKTTY